MRVFHFVLALAASAPLTAVAPGQAIAREVANTGCNFTTLARSEASRTYRVSCAPGGAKRLKVAANCRAETLKPGSFTVVCLGQKASAKRPLCHALPGSDIEKRSCLAGPQVRPVVDDWEARKLRRQLDRIEAKIDAAAECDARRRGGAWFRRW